MAVKIRFRQISKKIEESKTWKALAINMIEAIEIYVGTGEETEIDSQFLTDLKISAQETAERINSTSGDCENGCPKVICDLDRSLGGFHGDD